MYTIGQVAKQVNMPVSTLRYYDNEGFFPHLVRCSGIRKFSDNEIEALHIIECLKKSGLEIREIKKFMELEKTLDMLRFKCWYYEQAMQDGSEERIQKMLPDHLPKDIQQLYDHAHEK